MAGIFGKRFTRLLLEYVQMMRKENLWRVANLHEAKNNIIVVNCIDGASRDFISYFLCLKNEICINTSTNTTENNFSRF